MSQQIFTMSEENYQKMLDASKPVRYIVVGGHEPSSPQENANQAWQRLGKEMGFDWNTISPTGNNPRAFFATPIKTVV